MSEVKSIIEENQELKQAVVEAKESLQGYEKDYDELCLENETLKAELEALKSQVANYEDEEEEAMEDEEEAMEDEEAMEEDEEEEAMEEEKKADDKVEEQAKVLASALRQLGVAKPVSTKPQAVQMSNDEVLAKFASITDAKERGEFYAKHRTQIFN